MKIKSFFAVLCTLMMCVTLPVHAENYPYRSDYLWVTVPDHADWLYKTNENAKVEVQLYHYGMPFNGEVSYTIGGDMQSADRSGRVVLRNGKAVIDMGTSRKPGFRDLTLTAVVDGKSTKHHVKVGFSVDKIQPFTTEPADFTQFWRTQIDELHRTPLSYTKELAEEYCTDKMTCYLVKLKVDNAHSLYGYLFIPKGKTSCPAVICPPGAGIKTIKEPLRHRYYGENGMIRFETEIHGLDPRLPESTFKDISNALNSKGNAYLENGLDNRDNYYMRHVYLGLVRCVDLVTSLAEWDGMNVAFQGGSQGGALSIIGASLDDRVNLCVANHPALVDMAAYSQEGVTGGYPHFNRSPGMLTKEKIGVMAYYDVVNFARHLKCKTRMTWGYNDSTCPPTTSYACWNVMTCEKEPLITPINEHWTSEQTEYSHYEWIRDNLRR